MCRRFYQGVQGVIVVLGFVLCVNQVHAATLTWTNTLGGDWGNPLNWSPNQTPGPLDSATLSLNVSVTNYAPSLIFDFTLANGTFRSIAPLNVGGTMNWTGGSIASGSILTISSGATLNFTNNITRDIPGVTLNNAGTVIWSAGAIRGGNNTVIHNAGLWDCQSDATFTGNTFGGGSFFTNSGTFRKSVATATTTLSAVSLHNTGTVNLQTGTVNFAGGLTGAGNFTGAGEAQLSGNVNATVNGSLNWNGGNITGGSTLNVNGTVHWSSGSIGAGSVINVAAPAFLNITNGTHDLNGTTLDNLGTVLWSGGQIRGGAGATINNSGLWHSLADTTFNGSVFGGSSSFTNSGTFRKSVATGSTTFNSTPFHTAGTVDIQSGTAAFASGLTGDGTFSGAGFVQMSGNVNITINGVMNWGGGSMSSGSTLNVAANALLNLTNSATRDIPGSTLHNTGTVVWRLGNIRGGTGSAINNTGLWQVQGNFDFNNAFAGTWTFTNSGTFRKSLSSGTTTFSGVGIQNTGTVDVQTGTVAFSGGLTGDGTFSGAGYVQLGGNINATINGTMNLGGSSMSGGSTLNIASNALLNLTNNATRDIPGSVLNNAGTVVWKAGQIRGGTGSLINNSGLWHVQGDFDFNNAYGGNWTFTNSGTFQKSVASGVTSFSAVSFQTSGSVDVQTGTIAFSGGLVGNGTFGGAGLIQMGGNVNATVNGTMNWTGGGTLSSGSVLNIATNGTLNIVQTTAHDMPGTTLNNHGTVVWSGGQIRTGTDGIINNTGLWLVESASSLNTAFGGTAMFTNSGTFRKWVAAGTTTIDSGITFWNSGTTEVQSGSLALNGIPIQTEGNLRLTGGSLSVAQPFQLLGGLLAGSNTITGTVTNNSIVKPGDDVPGLLAVSGGYTQTADASLDVQLGSTNVATGYDRLAIGGTANFNGTLNVTLLDPFVPSVGDTFRVLTFGSRLNDFTEVNGLVIQTNLALIANYTGNALDLVAVSTNVPATPPVITSQPKNQIIINGQTAAFSVTATGTRPFHYQWQFSSTNLPTATNLNLTLLNAQTNQAGNYRVIITNSAGSVTSQVAVLIVKPVADLVIDQTSHPTNAFATQPVTFIWRSLNQGSQSAVAPWTETVSISANPNGTPATTLASIIATNSLISGQSVMRTQSVILPGGLNGTFYPVFRTDVANQVVEEDNETNNVTVSTVTMTVSSPDLQPVSIIAPPAAQFAQILSVSWITTNNGAAPAFSSWIDRLYLGANSNNLSGATLLTTLTVTNVPLAGGSALSNSASVTLPLAQNLSPGDYFLLVTADAANAIAETNENNNLLGKPIALSLPPVPDFAVLDVSAPANAQPGQQIQVSWAVTNRGSLSVTGVWSETIFIATNAAGAGAVEMATFNFTNTLNAGASLSRTQTLVIPITSPLGETWFRISADSRDDFFESNETNNITAAASSTLIPAVLTLQLSASQVAEGASPVQAIVTRNGSRALPLSVTITNSDASELAMPTNIVISSGQASATFNVSPLADGVVDGNQLVDIAVSAPGFASAVGQLSVLDTDKPTLTLSLATNSVQEGLTLAVTVTRDAGTNAPLIVNVASSNPGQLLPPVSVTLVEGQFSTTFAVLAVNDLLVELDAAYTISVSAANHNGSFTNVTVLDDDLPEVTLTFASTNISEAGGPQATTGTLTRTPVTATPIYVELVGSDNSAVLVPSLVVIPASQSSASFPVAAVDNDVLDGTKAVEVAVWIKTSAFGARVADDKSATLWVSDDEGPALTVTLAQSLVAEGLNPATTGTVSRNTATNNSLLVNLSSSDVAEATVAASVTIPAGATSAAFNITTPSDGATDGNKSVLITADAAGFAPGTATLTVSDANLPDLVVQSVTAPAVADTETFVNLGYTIRNQGFGTMVSNTIVQRIYLSTDPLPGGDTLMGEYTFSGALPSGSQFGQTFAVRLPQSAGEYWVIAETDVNNVIGEILEDNNTRVSVTPIQVNAAYNATVSTTLESAPAGTPVPMMGHAFKPSNNAPASFVLVNIHIYVRGTHRVISALTDASGNFSTAWHPLPGEAGAYEIGAAHPGDANAAAQDSFMLFGLNAVPAVTSVTLMGQTVVTGAVQVVNAGDTPLSGIAVQALNPPANLNVSATLATNSLGGLESTLLNYAFNSTDGLAAQGTVVVRLTSAEGATRDVPFNVTVKPLTPQLAVSPSPLVRGLKRGQQTLVTIAVTNVGGADSGPVTVSLPSLPWLNLAAANPLPSLQPGEGTEVTLQLMPGTNEPLTTVTGNLLLGGGSVTVVPFEFRLLSDSFGDLRVTAVDEFTYYAVGAPKLTNAAVVVRDAETGAVVTNGVTGADGEWFASQLAEGYYEVEVTADKHTAYKGTHLLAAGVTNNVEAFLSRQTVRYTWTVVPIQIEDRYRIVVETEFEANVPAPVVTITPSVIDLAELEDVMQVDLKIENHGLIAANDFELQFDEHPDVVFEPLISNLGTLPAKSSFTVPLVIRRVSASPAPAVGKNSFGQRVGACFATARAIHSFPCGPYENIQLTALSFPNAGQCISDVIRHLGWSWLPAGGGGIRLPPECVDCGQTWPYRGWFGNFTPGQRNENVILDTLLAAIYKAVPALAIPNPCDPECRDKLGDALRDCILPDFGLPEPPCPLLPGADCLGGLLTNPSQDQMRDCIADQLGCWFEHAKDKTGTGCLFDLLEACAPEEDEFETASALSGKGRKPLNFSGPYAGLLGTLQTRVDRVLAVDGFYDLLLGDPAWTETGQPDVVKSFFGSFLATIAPGSDAGSTVSASELNALQSQTLPVGVNNGHVQQLAERWNRSLDYWQAGIFSITNVPPGQSTDFFAFDQLGDAMSAATNAMLRSQAEGFASVAAGAGAALDELIEALSESDSGVCAKVKLRLDQEAVLSRDAFKATLEIDNTEGKPLENVYVTIGVLDSEGNDASELFGIHAPELSGISGTNGNGTLPDSQTGRLTWILVPTVDAAPEVETRYFVSGALNYIVNGTAVSVPLEPAQINVLPTPRLKVDYFHQRDVFSDDPYTDIVEPAIPFSLAVMVRNFGQGTARNFRITSAQPQIVENEKGLLIDFKIIATEVAGQNLKPTLTADMGDIGPGTNAIARWLMTSTLQGLFIDYKASFEHVDGLGNPKLSLIDEVNIHEMIRVVRAGGVFEDGRPDFLVNEVPDLRDLPDTLLLSDGSSNAVEVVTNAVITGTLSPGNLSVQLDAAMPGGWTYLRVPDPADGEYTLVSVVRSDNETVAVETNAWVTDRTFRGMGKKPDREYVLHLLDYNSTGGYTLNYALKPELDVTPPSSVVAALPAASSVAIPLNWSGNDDSGPVAAYDIYVSENGGPFQRWLAGVANTSGIYQATFGNGYAFYSVAVDAAGNREEAPATPDAQTTVLLSNHPPVMEVITNRTIVEGQTLSMAVAATDSDGDSLSFHLGASAPSGMILNPQSGQLTWVTGEGHGPGTNTVTVEARDNGIPQLNTSRTFQVVVLEDNVAPFLAPIEDVTISEGQLLTITNVALDTDLPPQPLRFSFGAGAPAGATLNTNTGVFSWQPTQTQGGVTYPISIVVTDGGEPPQNASRTFAVTVSDTQADFLLNIGSTQLLSGASASVPLKLVSSADLTNIVLTLNAGGQRLTNLALTTFAPELASAQVQSLGSDAYQLRFDSLPSLRLQGDLQLARLEFDTIANPHSAVANVKGDVVTGKRASSDLVSNGRTTDGKVFIVGLEPILDVSPATNRQLALTLYGIAGKRHALEKSADLNGTNAPSVVGFVELNGLRQELPLIAADEARAFFRAVRLPDSVLSIRASGGQLLVEWPEECGGCVLESATGVGGSWLPVGIEPQLVAGNWRVTLQLPSQPVFFRLLLY